MKNLFLVGVLFCICLGSQVTAQNKRWEIGYDALWLINKQSFPNSFMGKYHFTNKKKDRLAYRIRVGMNQNNYAWGNWSWNYYYYYDTAFFGSLKEKVELYKSHNLISRFGLEKKVDINKMFLFFYGADFHLGYNRYSDQRIFLYSYNDKRNMLVTNIENRITTGLVGFFGLRCRPLTWLVVSAESNLSMLLRRQSLKSKAQNVVGEFPTRRNTHWGYEINSSPIAFLNVAILLD